MTAKRPAFKKGRNRHPCDDGACYCMDCGQHWMRHTYTGMFCPPRAKQGADK